MASICHHNMLLRKTSRFGLLSKIQVRRPKTKPKSWLSLVAVGQAQHRRGPTCGSMGAWPSDHNAWAWSTHCMFHMIHAIFLRYFSRSTPPSMDWAGERQCDGLQLVSAGPIHDKEVALVHGVQCLFHDSDFYAVCRWIPVELLFDTKAIKRDRQPGSSCEDLKSF